MTLWESVRGVRSLLLSLGRCCLSGLDRRIRRHSRSDCSTRRFGRPDRAEQIVRQAGAVWESDRCLKESRTSKWY
jgi:hypothetical protein